MASHIDSPKVTTPMASAVRAHGHEGDLAEVDQPGVAEVHVEADGGEGEDHRIGADERLEAVLEDEAPVHGYPTLSFWPRIPWGRTSSTRISTTSAPTFFSSGDTHRASRSG